MFCLAIVVLYYYYVRVQLAPFLAQTVLIADLVDAKSTRDETNLGPRGKRVSNCENSGQKIQGPKTF